MSILNSAALWAANIAVCSNAVDFLVFVFDLLWEHENYVYNQRGSAIYRVYIG